MVTWNYRVIRTDYIFEGKTEPSYSVHRCYYEKSDDSIPKKWSQQPATPEGDSMEELKSDCSRFLLALQKPVLIEKRGKLMESKE